MFELESLVAASLEPCPPGAVYLAAVSGGADSTALLAALAAVRDAGAGFDLRCIHVEHGIREAAERQGDADFVRSLCAGYGIPCRVAVIPPGTIAACARDRGTGIEAAARRYRRRAWFRQARRIEAESGCPVTICTAHTATDLLETALMRILRGAGPAGLAAMPPCRGRLLRPLLAVNRAAVEQYLNAKNIPWREDSTNTDTRFLRNRIRHCLVPQLNEWFPAWRQGIAALAETQSRAAAFIRDESRLRVTWTKTSGGLSANAEQFFAQSAIVREEALFAAIDRLPARRKKNAASRSPLPAPRRSTVRLFCAGRLKAADLGPARVRRENGNIVLLTGKPHAAEYGFSLLIKAPGSYILKGVIIEVCASSLHNGKTCINQHETAGGFSALLPLALRRRFPGDCIAGGSVFRSGAGKVRAERGGWCAVDRLGPAAFIGPGGLLAGRTCRGADRDAKKFYTVIVRDRPTK
jgi:tRNA(Ile)-lysidine synthase